MGCLSDSLRSVCVVPDEATRATNLAAAVRQYRLHNGNKTPPWEKPEVNAELATLPAAASGAGDSAPPQAGDARRKRAREGDSGSADARAEIGQMPLPRSRGRPRKNPLPDPNAPKRPRGRPRKHPLPDPNATPKKLGRPRKHPVAPVPELPRGRPPRPPRMAAGDVAAAAAAAAGELVAGDLGGASLPSDAAADEDMAADADDEDEGDDGEGEEEEEEELEMPFLCPMEEDMPPSGQGTPSTPWKAPILALCDPGSDAEGDGEDSRMLGDAAASQPMVMAVEAPHCQHLPLLPTVSAVMPVVTAPASQRRTSPPPDTRASPPRSSNGIGAAAHVGAADTTADDNYDSDNSPLFDLPAGGISPWRAVGALADTLLGGMTTSPGFMHQPRSMSKGWSVHHGQHAVTAPAPALVPGSDGGAVSEAAAQPAADGTAVPLAPVRVATASVGARSTDDKDASVDDVVTPQACLSASIVEAQQLQPGGVGDDDSPLGRLPLPRALEHFFDAVRPGEDGGAGDDTPAMGVVSPVDEAARLHPAAVHHHHAAGSRQRSPPPPDVARGSQGEATACGLAMLAEESLSVALQSPPPAMSTMAPPPIAAVRRASAAGTMAAHHAVSGYTTGAPMAPHPAGHIRSGAAPGAANGRLSLDDSEVAAALEAAAAAATAAAAASVAARQTGIVSTPLSGGAAAWRAARGAPVGGGAPGSAQGGGGGGSASRMSLPPSSTGSARASRGSYLALLAATAPPAAVSTSTATTMTLVPTPGQARPSSQAHATPSSATATEGHPAAVQEQSPQSVLTQVSSPAVHDAVPGGGMHHGDSLGHHSNRGSYDGVFAVPPTQPPRGILKVTACAPPPVASPLASHVTVGSAHGHGVHVRCMAVVGPPIPADHGASVALNGGGVQATVTPAVAHHATASACNALLSLHDAYTALAQAAAQRLSLPIGADIAAADAALAAALTAAKEPAAKAREEAERLGALVVTTPEMAGEPPSGHFGRKTASVAGRLGAAAGGSALRKAVRFAEHAEVKQIER